MCIALCDIQRITRWICRLDGEGHLAGDCVQCPTMIPNNDAISSCCSSWAECLHYLWMAFLHRETPHHDSTVPDPHEKITIEPPHHDNSYQSGPQPASNAGVALADFAALPRGRGGAILSRRSGTSCIHVVFTGNSTSSRGVWASAEGRDGDGNGGRVPPLSGRGHGLGHEQGGKREDA